MNRDREQTIAFAAVFQALDCVRQLAETGRCDADNAAPLIDAIFAIDTDSAEVLYPPTRIRRGLAIAAEQLDRNPGDAITRMGVTVLRLERRLMSSPKLTETLRGRIQDIERARSGFGLQHDTILARLSEAYLETVSNLQPRVMVQGSPVHLQQERTVAHIRALLLAALRAAVLWRHVGGSGWRLFWRRAHWLREARQLAALD